jgi:hypothetical protein
MRTRIGDERGSAEVRRGADALDCLRERDEALRVRVREAVVAGRHGVGAERAREERDVAGLVRRDLLEAAADPVGVAGLLERLRIEFGERLVVQGVLEVLERECILEDDGVCRYRSDGESTCGREGLTVDAGGGGTARDAARSGRGGGGEPSEGDGGGNEGEHREGRGRVRGEGEGRGMVGGCPVIYAVL